MVCVPLSQCPEEPAKLPRLGAPPINTEAYQHSSVNGQKLASKPKSFPPHTTVAVIAQATVQTRSWLDSDPRLILQTLTSTRVHLNLKASASTALPLSHAKSNLRRVSTLGRPTIPKIRFTVLSRAVNLSVSTARVLSLVGLLLRHRSLSHLQPHPCAAFPSRLMSL
ncbi:hypothetical protein PHBOTO_006136 [Pseudozyma hubeiensis]|nr:hypothetical protein PHBOTO_006136 [Pseudozyma hubeiensis]